jgi:PEP-CTERM motif
MPMIAIRGRGRRSYAARFRHRPRPASVAAIGLLAAAIGLTALPAAPAMAGIVNIGNGASGTNPEGTSGAGDPNLIGNGTDISIEVQGSGSITAKALLAILIPNDTADLFGSTNPLGTITSYPNFPTLTPAVAGSSAFTGTGFGLGGTATYQGNGFWGAFSATGSAKLNSFLDSNFSNSLNASNFTGFDAGLGVPSLSSVTEYGVYTFAITTNTPLSHFGLADIQLPAGLPQGSIAVALDDALDSTVWTNAGGVDQAPPPTKVPEPGSLMLLASGLLALPWLRRRRKG